MAITFPSSPSAGDIFTSNGKSWQYVNGKWEVYAEIVAPDVFAVDAVNDVVHVYGSMTAGASASIASDLVVDTNTLVVDSTNNRVGIGKTNPSVLLDLEHATQANIHVNDSGGTVGGDTNARLSFLAGGGLAGQVGFLDTTDGTMTVQNSVGDIAVEIASAGNVTFDLYDGNVGIGTTSPETPLNIVTTNKLGSTFTGTTDGEGVRVDQSDYTAGNYVSLIEGSYDDGQTAPHVRIGAMFDGGGSHLALGTSNNYANGITNTAMFIDETGKVGIGTTSPQTPLHISQTGADALRIQKSNNDQQGSYISMWDDDARIGYIGYAGNDDLYLENEASAGKTFLSTNGTVRLTVDSSGNVGIGTTSPSQRLHVNGNLLLESDSTASGANAFFKTYASSSKRAIAIGGTSASTRRMMDFYNTNGVVGGISTNGSTTTFHTSSDYRLKENVVPVANASERLAVISVHEFNFIADPDTTVTGFLAHELAEHLPEAVIGEKDEVDEEGNPLMQGVDQSKVVPLLTAALQEALTTINDLTARIEALEAG